MHNPVLSPSSSQEGDEIEVQGNYLMTLKMPIVYYMLNKKLPGLLLIGRENVALPQVRSTITEHLPNGPEVVGQTERP